MNSMSSQPSRLVAIMYGLLPLLVAAGVLFVLIVVGGKAVEGYEMRQDARALERRIDDLRREHRQLSEELDYYRSDQYVEKVAREELGLVRQGEVAVVIVSQGDGRQPLSFSQSPIAPAPTATPGDRGTATWHRWLDLFIGQD